MKRAKIPFPFILPSGNPVGVLLIDNFSHDASFTHYRTRGYATPSVVGN